MHCGNASITTAHFILFTLTLIFIGSLTHQGDRLHCTLFGTSPYTVLAFSGINQISSSQQSQTKNLKIET